MKATYSIGTSSTISLSVTVGTEGFAQSKIYLRKEGEKPLLLATSASDDGNISKQALGDSTNLKDGVLAIYTMIDLSAISDGNVAAAMQKITATYDISGGPSGSTTIKMDDDDIAKLIDTKVATITKAIVLI
jgi:hypothetical protein